MSKASYRIIDYYLRPSKNVERKMILEVLKSIAKKQHIDYSYIGMGSLGFIDFRIFHKELMIKDMVSIEKKASDKDRFEFNKPLKINMVYTDSSTALRKLDIKNKDSVIWLDYDGNFNKDMVKDFTYIAANARPYSIALLTCRQSLDYYLDLDNNGTIDNYERFTEEFEEFVPYGIKKKDFERNNFSKLIQQMLVNAMDTKLSEINAASEASEQLRFKQVFFFTYSDGAPMLTIGGIMLKESSLKTFNSKFRTKTMDFIREKDKSYEIDIPILTKKETDFLNKYLPEDSMQEFITNTNLHKIPEPERKSYFSLYRFLPDFRETSY